MYNIKQEIIIDKTAFVNSIKFKFVSLLFCADCTAIIYCRHDDGQPPMQSKSCHIVELSVNDKILTFDDTVKHDHESCLYQKLLSYYTKTAHSDIDKPIFYIGFAQARTNGEKINGLEKMRIKLAFDNTETYIGKEFYLKEGERYTFEINDKSVEFRTDRIINTDDCRIIVYSVNGDYTLNFCLKDYLHFGGKFQNTIPCSIVSKDEVCGRKVCSCELPVKAVNDNLYVLLSVETSGEKSIEIIELT